MNIFSQLFRLVFLISIGSSFACIPRNTYNEMNTDELWNLATEGNTIGGCKISVGSLSSRAACYLYVKANTVGSGGDAGYPRTRSGGGTGCVRAPELPKGITTCYYNSASYDLTATQRAAICTDDGRLNAVRQLRMAIDDGQCDITFCRGPPGPPGLNCIPENVFDERDTDTVWNLAAEGNTIGGCRIQISPSTRAACYLYVKANTIGSGGDTGYPRTSSGGGTGCVRAPDFPKGITTCYYNSASYDLTAAQRAAICTNDGRLNAIRQLRIAIADGQCDVIFCPTTAPTPTPSPAPTSSSPFATPTPTPSPAPMSSSPFATPSPFACAPDSQYLEMSTDELWDAALFPNTIGGCTVRQAVGSGAACDLYVNSNTEGEGGYSGWPRTTDGRGTGCVRAPDFPKAVSTCYYHDPEYDLTAAEREDMCTGAGRTNAVVQLRHAIVNGQCNIIPCDRWDPMLLKVEARLPGWKCLHRKPSTTFFASTSEYILRVDGSCSSCSKLPTQAWKSAKIRTSRNRCNECREEVRRTPPSHHNFEKQNRKYIGKNCKLVRTIGCWPTFNDEEIFRCDSGDECLVAFFRDSMDVKCCTARQDCTGQGQACVRANRVRCQGTRLKKYSGRIRGSVAALFE